MQKVIIVILALATAALAFICVTQSQQLKAVRQQAAATREELRAESDKRVADTARIKELERAEARLEKQVKDFTQVTSNLRASEASQSSNATVLAQQLATVKKGGGPGGTGSGSDDGAGAFGKGMGEMLGTMMKDPAMREMMQDQQKSAIKMMYSSLFKDLKLTPEEKDKFIDTLAKSQLGNLTAAQDLTGKNGPEAAEAAGKQLEQTKKDADAEIKALLGDDRFAQYQDYQKNIGERMQLDQLNARLQGANVPLQDQQRAQLLDIMKAERDAKPPVIPSDASQNPRNLQAMMTADNIDKQLQWMEDYNKRVRERAASVLSPEQLKEYTDFQTQQASMQKFGLKMAKEMFGAGAQNNATATPAPTQAR